MKILIVDDNKVVLEGLQSLPLWEQLDIEVVISENVTQALDVIHRVEIDIVMTDIKMPGQSGLFLCKYLYNNYPWIYTIIVSAYQDFEYASEAIDYKVNKFLTKPVDIDELNQIIKKILVPKQKDKANEKSLLYQLIFGKKNQKELCMHIKKSKKITKFYVMISKSNDVKQWATLCCYDTDLGHYVYLIKVEDMVLNKGNKVGGVISDLMSDLDKIRTKHNDLILIKDVLYFYENSMHTERDIYNKRALHDETYSLINDKSKLLKHYLHQHEQSLEAIKRFFLNVKNRYYYLSQEDVIDLMHYYMILAMREERYIKKDKDFSCDQYYDYVRLAKTFDEALEELMRFIVALQEYHLEYLKDKDTRFIQELEDYVKNHLNQPLTLQVLSEEFNKSSSYISKKINMVLGRSFTDYLNVQRINMAKVLLKESDYTIKAIGIEVGYISMRHFLRTFKKYEACTPTEYRQLYSK